MTEGTGPERPPYGDLCAALADAAADLEGTEAVEREGAVEYRRHGAVFAECGRGSASFRLRPEIVAAAVRTPDTAAGARGAEWVTLRPRSLDAFTVDRAIAWFETAWRIAGEQPEQRATPH